MMLRVKQFVGTVCLVLGAPMAVIGTVILGVNLIRGSTPAPPHVVFVVMGWAWVAAGVWVKQRAERIRRTRRQAVLDGVICPARFLGSRPALGLSAAMAAADRMLTFHVELPNGSVAKHAVKMPAMGIEERFRDNPATLAFVHPRSGAIVMPFELRREVTVRD